MIHIMNKINWKRTLLLYFVIAVVAFSATRVEHSAYGSVPTLKVEPGTQPAPGLAPQNAKTITFTKVKLTAVDGDVVIRNLVIQNTGLSDDDVFSKVGFIGTPAYIAGTAFNTNHLYETKTSFTIKASTAVQLTLYGDMASSLSSWQGQKAALGLLRIDTDAPIIGTLPIVGPAQTINSTIVIGTLTTSAGPQDPARSKALELGTKRVVFTSTKVAVDGAEPIILKSAKWTQLGSVAIADLANVKAIVTLKDVVKEFAVTISTDGKDYSADFGSSIVMDKGDTAEVAILGDVVSGAGRTVSFKLMGSNVKGLGGTYGYNIKAATTHTDYTHTVGSGSLSVSPANLLSYMGEPKLGEIILTVKGEPIEISEFGIALTSGARTKVKLWDGWGNAVAGPVDSSSDGRVLWRQVWTAKEGTNKYYVTSTDLGSFEDKFWVRGIGKNTKKEYSVTGLPTP